MKLGSSIRRRRRGGRTVTRSEEDAKWREPLRFTGALLGLAVLGLAVGFFTATRLLFPAPPPPGDLFQVPDVSGMELERAAERLTEVGLGLGSVDLVRHPAADSGRVLGQAPLPGQLARPDTRVRVTVSLGPERRAVPDVMRLAGDWAVNVLRSSGFDVAVDSVEAEAPRGRVVEVEPSPGTEMGVPGEVRISVSLGPPRVPMPDLTGLEEEAARDTLRALGLAVAGVEEVFRFGANRGRVVDQRPDPGVEVERGGAVRFSVGRRGGADTLPGDERRPTDMLPNWRRPGDTVHIRTRPSRDTLPPVRFPTPRDTLRVPRRSRPDDTLTGGATDPSADAPRGNNVPRRP